MGDERFAVRVPAQRATVSSHGLPRVYSCQASLTGRGSWTWIGRPLLHSGLRSRRQQCTISVAFMATHVQRLWWKHCVLRTGVRTPPRRSAVHAPRRRRARAPVTPPCPTRSRHWQVRVCAANRRENVFHALAAISLAASPHSIALQLAANLAPRVQHCGSKGARMSSSAHVRSSRATRRPRGTLTRARPAPPPTSSSTRLSADPTRT